MIETVGKPSAWSVAPSGALGHLHVVGHLEADLSKLDEDMGDHLARLEARFGRLFLLLVAGCAKGEGASESEREDLRAQ